MQHISQPFPVSEIPELWLCGECPEGFTFLDGQLYDDGDLYKCDWCNWPTPDWSDLHKNNWGQLCDDCQYDYERNDYVIAGRP